MASTHTEGDARISFVLTVVAVLISGGAGALLGRRLPVPAGVLLGALVGVALLAGGGGALLGLPKLPAPSWVNDLLQVMLGMMVGFRMTRDALRSGAHALAPALLLVAVLVPAAVASALVAAPLTSIDAVTAVFAAVPGGLTQMSTMSVGFGADGAAVTTVQLVRVLLSVAIANALLGRIGPKGQPEPGKQEQAGAPGGSWYAGELKSFAVAAPWGVIGGFLGVVSPLPAGGIIGALVGSAAFRLLTQRPVPEARLRFAVQALAGGVMGLGVSGEFFGQIVRLAGAGALIIAAQMLLWLATGWMLVKLSGYDLPTAVLASAPGGMSDVVSTASQAGTDEVAVTFVHLVRIAIIVVAVPVFVTLVLAR